MDTLLRLPQIGKWFSLKLGNQMKLMQRIYQVKSTQNFTRCSLYTFTPKSVEDKSKTRKLVRSTIKL